MNILLSTFKNHIYVLFIRSHLVQSINKNWYLFLFVQFFLRFLLKEQAFNIKTILGDREFVETYAPLEHWFSFQWEQIWLMAENRLRPASWGWTFCYPAKCQCWTGCVFWTIWRCLLQQLWYLFRGFFFYTGVSTVVSGKWNHLYGRCSMLEKRGIFGIAMLDSQRCILGEVVPPYPRMVKLKFKGSHPKIKCCLWWCLFWLLLGRGDNPTYNLYTWICVFDAGKQGKRSYPKCWFFLVIYYIPWDPKSVPKSPTKLGSQVCEG